jgi:hypothetical protein
MLGRRPAILLTTAVADLTDFRLPTLEDYPGGLYSGRLGGCRTGKSLYDLAAYPGALPWTTTLEHSSAMPAVAVVL